MAGRPSRYLPKGRGVQYEEHHPTIICIYSNACSSTTASTAIENEPAYWPTEGWRTATPESQGMDSLNLINMLESILKRNLKIHSV